jgi:SNF2 family DNA or RNA helicase
VINIESKSESVYESLEKKLGVKMKVKPWKHQADALIRSRDISHFAFFFQVGTGKTLTCINALRVKYAQSKTLLPTLILSPPITLTNWKREWAMHSNIADDDVVILNGTGKERVKKLQSIMGRPKIIITNYESLLIKELFPLLQQYRPACLVCDESHKLKDSKSRRSEMATKLSDLATFKFLMTGSPVLNSMMDLFSQFRILDGGQTFGKNFFAFRAKYFYDKNSGSPSHVTWSDWRPRANTEKELRAKIALVSMHVEKKDCLDLPPLVKKKVFVEMSKDQKQAYDSMLSDFIAVVNEKAAVAELAITRGLRLQQIVSGFVSVEEGQGERSDAEFKENPRRDALKALLEDLTPNHKVIVWAVFKQNYSQVRSVIEELGVRHVEVHGEVTAKQKQEAVDLFNNDPDVRVFLGHPGSGGIGINLIPASYSIFYTRNFSLENDIQAEARNYRGGSEIHDKVTRIDIVCGGTIDEEVLKALDEKQQIGESVLRDIASKLRR